MSKFNVNDEVIVVATGEKGVVKAKEVTTANDGNKKHITIQYMVKVGEGFSNWKVFYRRELQKAVKMEEATESKYLTKVYDTPNGYKVTLVALADTYKYFEGDEVYDEVERQWEHIARLCKGKRLNIGYSICNPNDEYDIKVGIKIAKKRLHSRPFAHMVSKFSGEFNKETVIAIMDAKANYIINNIDKFISK